MATPYLQLKREEVASTQDVARSELRDLPVVVIAASQSGGRGRTGASWITAPRALAVSVAVFFDEGDPRPLSLMAGLAAARLTGPEIRLKWPNDVMVDGSKVGGVLVEIAEGVAVIGLGLNLHWPDPPAGMAGVFRDDPGGGRHAEIGALWAAELMAMLDGDGWPVDEYRSRCSTLGAEITWEPAGSGRARDILTDGRLVVDGPDGPEFLGSGAVRHVSA